jgi:hypothetical protein
MCPCRLDCLGRLPTIVEPNERDRVPAAAWLIEDVFVGEIPTLPDGLADDDGFLTEARQSEIGAEVEGGEPREEGESGASEDSESDRESGESSNEEDEEV